MCLPRMMPVAAPVAATNATTKQQTQDAAPPAFQAPDVTNLNFPALEGDWMDKLFDTDLLVVDAEGPTTTTTTADPVCPAPLPEFSIENVDAPLENQFDQVGMLDPTFASTEFPQMPLDTTPLTPHPDTSESECSPPSSPLEHSTSALHFTDNLFQIKQEPDLSIAVIPNLLDTVLAAAPPTPMDHTRPLVVPKVEQPLPPAHYLAKNNKPHPNKPKRIRKRKLVSEMDAGSLAKLRESNRVAAQRHRQIAKERKLAELRYVDELGATNVSLRKELADLQREKALLLPIVRATMNRVNENHRASEMFDLLLF
eukprot:m.228914 g.228914  ORF g.228914 m.228914 type:complete len:312 (-) comp26431_c0_seq5:553-1488(-)